ncbi:hypothetical protein JN06_02034 [Bacteroides zoogleoformans]|nr:hypothetical protein JN06_02034 [Bacteroides zoogleoformans]
MLQTKMRVTQEKVYAEKPIMQRDEIHRGIRCIIPIYTQDYQKWISIIRMVLV